MSTAWMLSRFELTKILYENRSASTIQFSADSPLQRGSAPTCDHNIDIHCLSAESPSNLTKILYEIGPSPQSSSSPIQVTARLPSTRGARDPPSPLQRGSPPTCDRHVCQLQRSVERVTGPSRHDINHRSAKARMRPRRAVRRKRWQRIRQICSPGTRWSTGIECEYSLRSAEQAAVGRIFGATTRSCTAHSIATGRWQPAATSRRRGRVTR